MWYSNKMGLVTIYLLCLCWCVVKSSPVPTGDRTNLVTTCAGVKPIFEMKNVSSSIPDKPISGVNLSICESSHSCCTREMETNLRLLVRKDFQGLLHHNSRSLEGLLATTSAKLQDHVTELSRQSENKTQALFSQVYQRLAVLAQGSIADMYSDLLRYLNTGSTRHITHDSSTSATIMPSITKVTTDLNLEDSVTTFFSRLFPLVYHQAVNSHFRDFTSDYKSCLLVTFSEIQPFGDIPRQLAHSVAKTMEATRVLLQALELGAQVLNSTDSLLMSDADGESENACHVALMRMSYCPRCQGLTRRVKPCAGYCLNVLRGCLTQHAAELDLPWNGFVEATERLVVAVKGHDTKPGIVLNVEEVIRSLDTRISEAIMYALENGPTLEKKVKRACGPASFAENYEQFEENQGHHHHRNTGPGHQEVLGVTLTQGHISTGHASRSGQHEDSLSTQLHHLLTSLTKSRGFYANLAESLCSDESFAETRDTADCWNGQRVGEYTKTVVAASVSAQKYNPELVWTQKSPDTRIAQLSDKLRHIRQVVLNQLTLAPESLSFMRDEEGSGSGHSPESWGDDEDHNTDWNDQGSGSGDLSTTEDPTGSPTYKTPNKGAPEGKQPARANIHQSTRLWVLLILALTLSRVRCNG